MTQALCAVCAVSVDDVRAVAAELPSRPQVIALDPTTLGETMGDVRTIAQATGTRDAALDLIARQRARIDRVRLAVKGAPVVPVAALEWLDPVFVAGHWTPQLVELAGGVDVAGFAGEHSEQTTWEAVAAAQPEVVVAMPCGYDAPRAAGGGDDVRRSAWPGSGPGASSRSTPRRTSRARGRAWSTASSCSPTCCTPTGSPPQRASRRRSTCRSPRRRVGDRRAG